MTVERSSLEPNSRAYREGKAEKAKHVEAVARGKRVKKPVAKQVKEAFVGEDAKESGTYFYETVILPAVKVAASDVVNAFLDAMRSGVNLVLFGDTDIPKKGGRLGNPSYSGGRVDYSGISSGGVPRRESGTWKGVYESAQLYFDARESAAEVLAWLRELADQYDSVTVDDLYSLAEIDNGGNFTLAEYGWYANSLANAHIVRKRDGWLLSLPRPVKLNVR